MTLAAKQATDLAVVAQAMRDARRVTAICHENPDADTIGAAVAVSLIAARLGAETEIVSADGFPPAFEFLPGADRVRRRPELAPDLAVICDAATLERVGRIATEEAEWFAGARILNVDHHISSSYYGDLTWWIPRRRRPARCSPAGGRPRDRARRRTGNRPDDRDRARQPGILRQATSGETLRIAARLVDAGAPIDVNRRILSELPFATIALWGKMLAGVGSDSGDRIVHTALMLSMLDETGTEQHDADGLAEFLAKAKGADVTLLLRELGPDETRVSVRTSEAVDATAITSRFGGGGHVRRGGCTVRRHVAEAVGLVLDASRAALDGGRRRAGPVLRRTAVQRQYASASSRSRGPGSLVAIIRSRDESRMLLLGLWQLDNLSLWRDEVSSIAFAKASLGDLLTIVGRDRGRPAWPTWRPTTCSFTSG